MTAFFRTFHLSIHSNRTLQCYISCSLCSWESATKETKN